MNISAAESRHLKDSDANNPKFTITARGKNSTVASVTSRAIAGHSCATEAGLFFLSAKERLTRGVIDEGFARSSSGERPVGLFRRMIPHRNAQSLRAFDRLKISRWG